MRSRNIITKMFVAACNAGKVWTEIRNSYDAPKDVIVNSANASSVPLKTPPLIIAPSKFETPSSSSSRAGLIGSFEA